MCIRGQEFSSGLQETFGLGSQNWGSWTSPARAMFSCCFNAVHTCLPWQHPSSEVGDAVPVPPGSAAMKSPVAFYRRLLPVWGCLCLGSCLFLLLCLVFLNWV